MVEYCIRGFGLQRAISGMMHKFLLLARNLKIHQFLELSPWSSCPIGHAGSN